MALPRFLRDLKGALEREAGLRPDIAEAVVNEIRTMEGFYIEGSEIKPSIYFEIMIRSIFAMIPSAKEELEALYKYNYAKAEVRKVYSINVSVMQGVELDPKEILKVIELVKKGRDISDEETAIRFVEVIARYRLEGDAFLEIFNEKDKGFVKQGIELVLKRGQLDKEIKIPGGIPVFSGTDLQSGLQDICKYADKKIDRIITDLEITKDAKLNETIPDIIDADLLVGNIRLEGDIYTMEAYGEIILEDLKEMERLGTLHILCADEEQRRAVHSWLLKNGITNARYILAGSIQEEAVKLGKDAVWMVSHAMADIIKDKLPLTHRLVKGREDPVENDLILMSKTRRILKYEDTDVIKDALTQFYKLYFTGAGFSKEKIAEMIEEIVSKISEGQLIVIELPKPIPVMKVFMLMLKNKIEVISIAA